MKLHITRNNLLKRNACTPGLHQFDMVYPGIDDNQQIELLEIAENPKFETEYVIWALRATVEDSKSVSVALAQACAGRAKRYAAAARARAYTAYTAAAYASAAADAARAADYAAYDTAYDDAAYGAERKLQRKHLIKLLKELK